MVPPTIDAVCPPTHTHTPRPKPFNGDFVSFDGSDPRYECLFAPSRAGELTERRKVAIFEGMLRASAPRPEPMTGTTTETKNRRLRVGFVVDWIDEYYQTTVLKGVAQVAQERGVELIVLPGGVIGADHDHGAARNGLYKLISKSEFDGLVMMTGTLGNEKGVEISKDVCPDFPSERICHVAIEVPGSPSVLIDNKIGVHNAVEHLARVHKKTKIGFIQGPAHNAEAQERYKAYLEAMEMQRLRVDPRLTLPGDFRRDAGVRAAEILFDERKVELYDVDAIVAASDSMAVTFLDELRRRKIRVPSQIAVIGFDDIEEARFTVPPLSSVWQPLLDQGREAMLAVLDSIAGKPDQRARVLQTACRFRRSCGCTSEELGFLTERPKSDTRMSLEASVLRRQEQIIEEVEWAAPAELITHDPTWKESFFEAVLTGVRGRPEDFRDRIDMLFESIIMSGGEVAAGMVMISALRRQLSVCAGDNPGQLRQVESLMHDARILASDAIERAQAYRRIGVERFTRVVADMSTRLMQAESETQLRQLIAEELPRTGLGTALVCAFSPGDPSRSHLIAGLWMGKAVPEAVIGDVFESTELIPPGLKRSTETWVIQPLYSNQVQRGFAVFKWGEAPGYLYEILRTTLCRALSRLPASS